MEYRTLYRVKAFNKPGLSPTEKNGTDVGYVPGGYTFTPVSNVNGWLAIASNQWVPAYACEQFVVVPPPEPSSAWVRAVLIDAKGVLVEFVPK